LDIILREVRHTHSPGTPYQREVLRGVDLHIRQGDFVWIYGPEGAGKTTLLEILNGLIRPSHGTIVWDGIGWEDPGLDLQKVRQRVGLVFQIPERQLFASTVWEDIAFGLGWKGVQDPVETAGMVNRVCDVLGLDLGKLAQVSPFQLSGGERRLAALAGILVLSPDVLVLDEPFSRLDRRYCRRLVDVLLRSNGTGCSIVVASHDIPKGRLGATLRTFRLDRGKLRKGDLRQATCE
jgi:energy-coupling factor transport system ATP-binding protein